MVSNEGKEMHTIKEWAEITGIKLKNYDGYMNIYEKLSQADTRDFYKNTASRFRDAGDLLCTIDGFESGLLGCTMIFPTAEELTRIADFMPKYAELNIDIMLNPAIQSMFEEMSAQERIDTLKQILHKLEIKKSIRQKSIDRYGEEQVPLEQIDNKSVKYNKLMVFFKGIKTVEELELYLFDSITKEINNMLNSHNFNKRNKVFKNLKLLFELSINAHRRNTKKSKKNIEEQFIYVDSPYKKEEDFELEFNMYGGSSKKSSGVVFHDSKSNISGTIMMPSKDTTDLDEEIDPESKGRKL